MLLDWVSQIVKLGNIEAGRDVSEHELEVGRERDLVQQQLLLCVLLLFARDPPQPMQQMLRSGNLRELFAQISH